MTEVVDWRRYKGLSDDEDHIFRGELELEDVKKSVQKRVLLSCFFFEQTREFNKIVSGERKILIRSKKFKTSNIDPM